MTETIQIGNVLGTDAGANVFFLAFMKCAKKGMRPAGEVVLGGKPGWNTPQINDAGEVTFFCQAGFVSKFNLSYNYGGQQVSKDTKNLGLGEVESIAIPAGAVNIVAKGYMISAGDHLLFMQNIPAPTYTCYKTYGAIGSPQWGTDWPLKDPFTLKLFHQGGYVGKFQIDYHFEGRIITVETGDQTAGWANTYTIPETATNIQVRHGAARASPGNGGASPSTTPSPTRPTNASRFTAPRSTSSGQRIVNENCCWLLAIGCWLLAIGYLPTANG